MRSLVCSFFRVGLSLDQIFLALVRIVFLLSDFVLDRPVLENCGLQVQLGTLDVLLERDSLVLDPPTTLENLDVLLIRAQLFSFLPKVDIVSLRLNLALLNLTVVLDDLLLRSLSLNSSVFLTILKV